MNTLSRLPANAIHSRQFTLVTTTNPAHEPITELIAQLALRGPLYVIAGNDWLPSYSLARLIRQETHEVKQTLQHVHTARAFTCYQLLDLIANIRPDEEPLLLLDCLHTFQDDDIPLQVRLRVLRQCCDYLQRLAFRKSVAVLVEELMSEDYETLYRILEQSADETLRFEPEPERACQPALF